MVCEKELLSAKIMASFGVYDTSEIRKRATYIIVNKDSSIVASYLSLKMDGIALTSLTNNCWTMGFLTVDGPSVLV